jgi:hypothetical protein
MIRAIKKQSETVSYLVSVDYDGLEDTVLVTVTDKKHLHFARIGINSHVSVPAPLWDAFKRSITEKLTGNETTT